MAARFRRILCPTDLSRESNSVLPIAALLGGPESTVHLVHVRPGAYVVTGMDALPVLLCPPEPEQESRWVRSALRRLEKMAERHVKGRVRAVECHVLTGSDTARQIVDFARARHMDVIVLATHGPRGVERLLLGSIASAVARRSAVPVILLHRGRPRRSSKRRRIASTVATTLVDRVASPRTRGRPS